MIYLRNRNKELLIPLNNPLSIVHGNRIGYDGNRWYLIALNNNYDLHNPIIVDAFDTYDECKSALDFIQDGIMSERKVVIDMVEL